MPTLNVDIREQQSDIDYLRTQLPMKGIDVKVAMWEVADFFIGNQLGIERKNPGDFIQSMRGRLWQQAVELKGQFDHAFIVVTGDMSDLLNYPGANPNAVWAAVNSLNCRYRTPVLFCGRGATNLAEQIYWLAVKATDERAVDYTPVRKAAPTKDLQLALISSLPGIGQEKAKRILKEYGSPMRALLGIETWSDRVDGIGKKTVEKLTTLLNDLEGSR